MSTHRAVILVWVLGSIVACSSPAHSPEEQEPAVVATILGSELSRIVLSASAADRLDIQTEPVAEADGTLVVPSSAVIIDELGRYWVYTNPEPLTFVRAQLADPYEDGTDSHFTAGVEVGTPVVVVGVPELYGTEHGIGK